MMRFILILGLLFFTNFIFGQKVITNIDTSNYYEYYVDLHSKSELVKGRTLNWLRENDVVPILMEELKTAGYKWLSDYTLFEIDSGKYVVLSAYCRKSNFGFLYFSGHRYPINKNDRKDFTKSRGGRSYLSYCYKVSGERDIYKIDNIPANIFVLKENCYWFQIPKVKEDEKYLVTKERIIEILRQDIRKYLENAPKPEN